MPDNPGELVCDQIRRGIDATLEIGHREEAESTVVRVLDEGWPDDLKGYAVQYLSENLSGRRKDTPDLFRQRLRFIQECVPSQALLLKYDHPIHRLLTARLSFLVALRRTLTAAQWDEMCMNPDQARFFSRIQWAITIGFQSLEAEDYERFSKRELTPVDAEEGFDHKAEELRDVLRTTGFGRIANSITPKIMMVRPKGDNHYHGRTGGVYGEYPAVSEIHIGIGDDMREYLLSVLTHEVGHNLEKRLEHHSRGQEWLDRYAASAMITPPSFSSYALSYRFTNKIDPSQFYFSPYIRECFAEEFRLFWERPETLPQDRLTIFDEICDDLFPDVDRDEMRGKMREVLGNYYGKSVTDITEPTDCDNAKKMVKKRERGQSEKNREKCEQIIAGMTNEEMRYWIGVADSPSSDDEPFRLLNEIEKCPKPVRRLYYSIKAGEFDQDFVLGAIKDRLKEPPATPH